jgi:16S rRNA U1498 N3-methylase RsmE
VEGQMSTLYLVRVRRPRKEDSFKLFKRESRAWLYRNKIMTSKTTYILGVDIKPVNWEKL